MNSALPLTLQHSAELAAFLGVKQVFLVREDMLPQGGGKKRRSLSRFASRIGPDQTIHVLSYAGSHTAYTLARMLPGNTVQLYGRRYRGGSYRRTMMRKLAELPNVVQIDAPLPLLLLRYYGRKWQKRGNDVFLALGGSLGRDGAYTQAAAEVLARLDEHTQHVVAVASGDLLQALRTRTSRVWGILTQPLFIRLLKGLRLKGTRGFRIISLDQRVRIMREIRRLTGENWDPIFMGSIFAWLHRQQHLPSSLCIWVTCPHGIQWDTTPHRQTASRNAPANKVRTAPPV